MIASSIPVTPVAPLEVPDLRQSSPASGPSFDVILRSAIDSVQNSSAGAANMMESFLSGDTQDLHTVAIATQKAALQLDAFLQVRNKLVQAYQEVMRMQL